MDVEFKYITIGNSLVLHDVELFHSLFHSAAYLFSPPDSPSPDAPPPPPFPAAFIFRHSEYIPRKVMHAALQREDSGTKTNPIIFSPSVCPPADRCQYRHPFPPGP